MLSKLKGILEQAPEKGYFCRMTEPDFRRASDHWCSLREIKLLETLYKGPAGADKAFIIN